MSSFMPAGVGAAAADISVRTAPPLHEVRPLSEPVKILLSAVGPDGSPAENGMIEVRLDAPRPGRLISTDFPVVEGTSLVEMILPLSESKVEWDYVFPIRGEYRLRVRLLDGFERGTEETLYLSIGESRRKWLYLGSFMAALFFVGFAAGRIFTRSSSRASGEINVGVLILVGILYSAGAAPAFAAAPSEEPYLTELKIDEATVGKPAAIRWKLYDRETGASRSAALTLSITHLEKALPVFSLTKLPVNGEFSLSFQFTDGTEYQIVAVGETEDGISVRREQIVSVNPVESPARTIIPAIVMFLALIGLGLLAGRWSVVRSAVRAEHTAH